MTLGQLKTVIDKLLDSGHAIHDTDVRLHVETSPGRYSSCELTVVECGHTVLFIHDRAPKEQKE